MAVPLPAHNDVNSWKFLLRRLSRSFKHRKPVGAEIPLISACLSAFIFGDYQLLYRFFPIAYWPANGYATWFKQLAHVLPQGGLTYVSGSLLTALTNLCNGLDESRYTT